MYCWASTSIIAARVCRVSTAASAVPIVIAGKIKASGPAKSSPGKGSQRSFTPNARIRRGPSQMFGIARPATATVEAILSQPLPAWAAAIVPSGIATNQATSSAAIARTIVYGKTSRIIDQTERSGCLNEVPILPSAMLPRKERYCSPTGRSRSSARRSSAFSSGPAWSPRIASTGSPGINRTNKKTIVTRPTTVSSARTRRPARYRKRPGDIIGAIVRPIPVRVGFLSTEATFPRRALRSPRRARRSPRRALGRGSVRRRSLLRLCRG